jgi:hypothetical protein
VFWSWNKRHLLIDNFPSSGIRVGKNWEFVFSCESKQAWARLYALRKWSGSMMLAFNSWRGVMKILTIAGLLPPAATSSPHLHNRVLHFAAKIRVIWSRCQSTILAKRWKGLLALRSASTRFAIPRISGDSYLFKRPESQQHFPIIVFAWRWYRGQGDGPGGAVQDIRRGHRVNIETTTADAKQEPQRQA